MFIFFKLIDSSYSFNWDSHKQLQNYIRFLRKMDIFGFTTQGVNYDKFRPRYPNSLIQKALASSKNKGKYLDIATGTGYLLFQFAPHFLNSKGIDISKKMLDTAAQKLDQFKSKYPQNKLELELKDIMEISSQQKYDLITVGQALHYFPKIEPMQKIKSLLHKDGRFVTYGYIFQKVVSKNQQEGEVFNRFYSKVKPYFTFNRDELHNHYADKVLYPFEQVFPKVQRQLVEVPLEMNKLEYISYLKTMSGYNIYVEKNKQDPILQVQNNCAEEITILMEYFSITCSQV